MCIMTLIENYNVYSLYHTSIFEWRKTFFYLKPHREAYTKSRLMDFIITYGKCDGKMNDIM